MQREWLEHQHLPWDPSPPTPFRIAPLSPLPKPPVTVMGYLPYWNIGKPTLVLHLDRLHVLAYFGASLTADGQVNDIHHWGGPVLTDLIEQAHAAGVLVVLCVTNFDSASIGAFLSSPSARAVAVSNLVSLVASAGGDGVNVDFEGLPKANKGDFVAFIAELKHALDTALAQSHVSLATPAVDWSGAFDYDRLAEASDGLFIMGYDYHWRGGPPGPVSPLQPSATWGKYSLAWTIDDYIQWGGDHNRPRFILGLPLYGFDWPTTGPEVPGTATAKAEARFYARCQREALVHGWQWDDDSSTPYYTYQDSGWHQVWCEDRKSLALKYALVAARGLGGVGFWALGYEEDLGEVWEELDAAFPIQPPPEVGLPDAAPDSAGGSSDAALDSEMVSPAETPETYPSDQAPLHDAAPDPLPSDVVADPKSRASGQCASGCRTPTCPAGNPPLSPLAILAAMLIYRLARRISPRGEG